MCPANELKIIPGYYNCGIKMSNNKEIKDETILPIISQIEGKMSSFVEEWTLMY